MSSEVLKEYCNHLTLEKRLELDFIQFHRELLLSRSQAQGKMCILTYYKLMWSVFAEM